MNNITIITTDYSLLAKEIKYSSRSVNFAFVVEDISFFEKCSLTDVHNAILLRQKNIYFSFFISQSFIDSCHEYDLFIQYFFHPKYFSHLGKPALNFDKAAYGKYQGQGVITKLESLAIKQGYQGIEVVNFTNEITNLDRDDNVFIDDKNAISVIYFELLFKQFYTSKYIGLSSVNLEEKLLMLFQAELKLKEENPKQFFLMKRWEELEKLNDYLETELKVTREDLENQKTYLGFFKDKDEALKINEFYHTEYEILPLWYKQLGHVIKVVTGKRTLRSLFDNNVKKYKD